MMFRMPLSACAVALALLVHVTGAWAQTGDMLGGQLINSLSGDPVPGATVTLEELRREVVSAADGSFSFDAVPPGTYHLSVRADGYSSRRTEVAAGPGQAELVVPVDPELHFEEVLSVGPEARSQFDSFQPTSVLAGQELSKQLEMSLGATLERQPGVTARSFGPASSRPVIRGLDGDRVLILQDGQRMGDLSSQSGDHGVTVNPASAQRIEVVRGPATLLYGANAIGGLVNVITDQIPTRPTTGASGNVTFDLGSAATEAGTAGDVHVGNGTFALHVGGGGRRSGDVGTPLGAVVNSQSRSGFGNVGLSWTGDRRYVGGSYGYDDTRYGIPVVDDGQLQLTPRRHAVSFRAGGEGLPGLFEAYRTTLAIRRYRHEELEGADVGTAFINRTTDFELMGSHRPIGRMKGSLGAWILRRSFDAQGAEALSPAVDQNGLAAFFYEEVEWPHVTAQFGGRVDHVDYGPAGETSRTFTSGSGSLGLLVRPAAADDRLTLALSVARSSRNPALEELFFFGNHHGNFAFEIGNPGIGPERATGVDLSLRWRTARISGEVTYFRNDIADYIFRSPLSEDAFLAREEEFDARFPGRHGDEEAHEHGEDELPIVEYVAADSLLQGVEAHADVQIHPRLTAEAGLDYVRGTLSTTGEALPRIPPLRFRGGLRYQANAFQAGGEVVAAAAQERVFREETPNARYGLLRLYAAYSLQTGAAVSTFTVRMDNVTDALYRNHLSLIKDVVPEMGRNVRVLYNVTF